MTSPLISIVTISYNAVAEIEKTILSVINQSYINTEYIIVDGGSSDGTIDIIKKYETNNIQWISEPDKGRYDAMNKGIKKAKGEWIIFMNSGDVFHDNNVLEKIFFQQDYRNNVAIVYGNTDLYNKDKYISAYKKKPFYKSIMPYRTGMGICHQSIFMRTYLAKKLMFNLRYLISADFDMVYKIYKMGFEIVHVPVTVANFDINGISAQPEHNITILHESMAIFRNANPKKSIQYLIYLLFYSLMRIKYKHVI